MNSCGLWRAFVAAVREVAGALRSAQSWEVGMAQFFAKRKKHPVQGLGSLCLWGMAGRGR